MTAYAGGLVQSTQEIVELILDSNRNTLLALDLKVRLVLYCTHLTDIGYPGFNWHNGYRYWSTRG